MNQHQFREHLVECVDLLGRMLKDFDTDPEFLSAPHNAEKLRDISPR